MIYFFILYSLHSKVPTRFPTLLSKKDRLTTRFGRFGWGKKAKKTYNDSYKQAEGGYSSCLCYDNHKGVSSLLRECCFLNKTSANAPTESEVAPFDHYNIIDRRKQEVHLWNLCIGRGRVISVKRKVANFRVLLDREGMRYQFFCALSGALVCTTRPFHADASEEGLMFAWETEGKKHFNHCSKCGNWVIDGMYNVDVLECVDCAPYETTPLYCKACGTKVEEKANRCSCCGAVLTYKGGAE